MVAQLLRCAIANCSNTGAVRRSVVAQPPSIFSPVEPQQPHAQATTMVLIHQRLLGLRQAPTPSATAEERYDPQALGAALLERHPPHILTALYTSRSD